MGCAIASEEEAGLIWAGDHSITFAGLLGRMIRVRLVDSAAHLGTAQVEHSADDGGAALHGTRPCEKVLGFPPSRTVHDAVFNLNPGRQGLLELVGGLLLALCGSTRTVAFILAGERGVAYFMAHAPRGFFPLRGACRLCRNCCPSYGGVLNLSSSSGGFHLPTRLRLSGKPRPQDSARPVGDTVR